MYIKKQQLLYPHNVIQDVIKFMMYLYWILIIAVGIYPCQSYECPKDVDHCETSLHIGYAFTMIDPEIGPVYSHNRKLYSAQNNSIEVPIENIITADGWKVTRSLVVANESMPGPSIVIHQNQTITIMVYNNLVNDAVTIHWHGIDQLDWPYMDGVAFVTQCPILPGQSFNYTFQPTFGGTYWYHSHMGNQRDQGLYGAFIVLRDRDEQPFSQQHILQIQEWNHLYNPIKLLKANLAGLHTLAQSVLINGLGQFENNMSPLLFITVEKSKIYRFRVIGVGPDKPLMFSISGLKLTVIETDGFEIEPVDVDKIIVWPAERYDFMLNLTNTQPGIYNITVHVLQNKHLRILDDVLGLGFLNVTDDNSVPNQPIVRNPPMKDIVLNCPFETYPNENDIDCVPVSELKSLGNIPDDRFQAFVLSDDETNKRETHFLNFGFPDDTSSINGRKFIWPTVSALTQPSEVDTSCSDCGEEKICSCPHSLNLKHGTEVTIVLLNLGTGMFISHPIHMHGHTYKVLKMGFPTVLPNGTIKPNEDIKCSNTLPNDKSYCNKAGWANMSWNDEIPDLNLINPVRKDTVIVPYGGYVVIRIYAANPGNWFMHCHIDMHMINGMALMLNESFDVLQEKLPIPPGFPSCHSFGSQSIPLSTAPQTQTQSDESTSNNMAGIIVLAIVVVLLLVALILVVIKWKRSSSAPSMDPPRELATRS